MAIEPGLQAKYAIAISPEAIKDNAARTSTVVDTLGYDYCTILFLYGASDIAEATLKVTECDTSGGSYSDVTGLIWGTSADITGTTSTLPSATDDNKIFAFDIDLRNRQRYLKCEATAGNGTSGSYGAAVAILTRGDNAPVTAAERGCAQILRV